MGDYRKLEFTDLRLSEAGITAEEMALAAQQCIRAEDFDLYTSDAVLHLRWNPNAPGLTTDLMMRLDERLRFEMGFKSVVLQEDFSLELPGAVLIGVDPGRPLDAVTSQEMSQVIVAIASHFFKVSGSSIG